MPPVARSSVPHSRLKWEKFYTRFQTETALACEQALLFGRASRECASPLARSHVLVRLASLAQIGELARRIKRRKNHTLWGGKYLGLSTSCSATFWQLVFRANFSFRANFCIQSNFSSYLLILRYQRSF